MKPVVIRQLLMELHLTNEVYMTISCHKFTQNHTILVLLQLLYKNTMYAVTKSDRNYNFTRFVEYLKK